MSIGQVGDIPRGGMCAWKLPADESGPSAARSLLGAAMTSLGLGRDLADEATLVVSELATNALNHAVRAIPASPPRPPELWLWARTTPQPQLVVSVFDSSRSSWPNTTPKDLMDEHGKGLDIVGVVAAAWGAHRSRSCLDQPGNPGKAVWAAFPLPNSWCNFLPATEPLRVARDPASALSARGIPKISQGHGSAVSLVSIPLVPREELNVWLDQNHIAFANSDGTYTRRRVIDLYDVVELLIRRHEERGGGA